MRFIKPALVLLFLAGVHFAHAEDKCSSQIKEEKGQYSGCTTTVNGHVNNSNPRELTRLGCETFCSALAKPQDLFFRSNALGVATFRTFDSK